MVLKTEGKLRSLPDVLSTLLITIPANEYVEVLFRSAKLNGYVYVRYNGVCGYINDLYLRPKRSFNRSEQKAGKIAGNANLIKNRFRSSDKDSEEHWLRRVKVTRGFSNQSIDGLSIGLRVGFPASVLHIKHLFNDKKGRPLHGFDASLNMGKWIDANLLYCYHYNLIGSSYIFKHYSGAGFGFGSYFKDANVNSFGNSFRNNFDRLRITFIPVSGMEWTPPRASGNLKISFDYRPAIDLLHPSFVTWWNVGCSFRFNF
jgi:hypothetical protein